MHDLLERKATPLALYMLGIVDRIEASQGQEPEPDEIRSKIKHLLGAFDVFGAEAEAYRLAKSAFVFWIDEVLVNSNWSFASDWKDCPLERELFGSRSRAWKFFENANLARALERTNALETFAWTAALGFRGIYRNDSLGFGGELREATPAEETSPAVSVENPSEGTAAAESGSTTVIGRVKPGLKRPMDQTVSSLPHSLDEWACAVFEEICPGSPVPFEPANISGSARSASPFRGAEHLRRWSLALTAAIVLTLFLALLGGGFL